MFPDLAKIRAVSMVFSTSIELPDTAVKELFRMTKTLPQGNARFYSTYDKHLARVILEKGRRRPKTDKVKCSLDFSYAPADVDAKIQPDDPSVDKMMSIIKPFAKDQYEFECRVVFEFDKKSNPRAIMSLPLRFTESPNVPFDQISGVHVIKHDGNRIKYHAYLDTSEDSGLFVNTIFDFVAAINDELPDRILANGKVILDSFTCEKTAHV